MISVPPPTLQSVPNKARAEIECAAETPRYTKPSINEMKNMFGLILVGLIRILEKQNTSEWRRAWASRRDEPSIHVFTFWLVRVSMFQADALVWGSKITSTSDWSCWWVYWAVPFHRQRSSPVSTYWEKPPNESRGEMLPLGLSEVSHSLRGKAGMAGKREVWKGCLRKHTNGKPRNVYKAVT